MLEYLRGLNCQATVSGHEKAVVSVVYSFDGKLLATACKSEKFRTAATAHRDFYYVIVLAFLNFNCTRSC